MLRRLLFIPFLIVLSACSYALDGSFQKLTVLTPGAESAVCNVYVDDLRYKVYPPQTIDVFKSKEDMVVDCLAPGNRRKKLVVESGIEGSTYGNIVTGIVPGAAWDYTSGAMFKYPDVVEVSFYDIPIRPEALPAQNNPDIKQPEDYDLEEFRPGEPRLNEDRYRTVTEIRKREIPEEITPAPYITSGPVKSGDKGNLMAVTPSGSAPAGAVSGPVPLYPGQ